MEIQNPSFWSCKDEADFFTRKMREGVAREDLFYTFEKGLFAYKPNPKEIKTGKKIGKHVLQSRNPLIGSYTECWCRKFFTNIAQGRGWDAVNGVVCSKLGLSQESPADLAFCTKGTKGGVEQDPKNIKLIFEVKMSIVNNYQLVDKHAKFCGDYRKHEGRPSFQRSDSMLKAIGKAINIRVSCAAASEIPIIILGNAPITKKYIDIVNDLKRAGVIQSFISVYPNPTADKIYGGGGGVRSAFKTFGNYDDLSAHIENIVDEDRNFLSSMLPKEKLGQFIEISAREADKVARANKFLELIGSGEQ